MALDAVINFGKVSVSTTYDADDTSIALSEGHGAKLPQPSTAGAFNLVWWNSTDYPDPSDDPNVEIVRCTARSTDTLTVTRAQEGTGASTKSTADKVYKMIIAPTSKTITDIGSAIDAKVADAINDGTTTIAPSQNAVFDALALKVKNDGSVNPTNLLSNGDFENWSAGTAVAPDGWTAYGSPTIAREATTVKHGTYSLKLTVGTSGWGFNYDLGSQIGITYCKGRTFTLSMWVWCDTANSATIQLLDGVNQTSAVHTGNSTWQLLKCSYTVDNSATILYIRPICVQTSGNAYFDGAMCVEGESAFAFSDKPAGYLTGTFTPTLTGFTVVGTAPAVNGRWTKVGNLVYFEITILAGAGGNTSIASVAASSYLSTLPFTPAYGATFGISNVSMVSYGCGFVWTDSLIYTPVWSACTVSIILSGTYRTA